MVDSDGMWTKVFSFKVYDVANQAQNPPTVTIELSTTWHQCVRLLIDDGMGESAQCMLDAEQAERLTVELGRALQGRGPNKQLAAEIDRLAQDLDE